MSTPKIEPWIIEAAQEQARWVCEDRTDLHEMEQGFAAIIARHAPSESVNGRLLAAAKALIAGPLYGADLREQLETAVTAAESAPASLERELADTLRQAMQYIARVDGPTIHEQARAVLRKYDEAKKFRKPQP